MDKLTLLSGATIPKPTQLVDMFFAEEWPYYDGIADADPIRISPVDIVATLSVNSFLNSATRIRSVHRGLVAGCESYLPSVPVDADLRNFPVDQLVALLDRACQVPYVLIPVATKVLHRKRRGLIPMLDNVVIGYYLDAMNRRDLVSASQDKKRAAEAARVPLEGFRADLEAAWADLNELRRRLDSNGLPVTELRILEVLVWMWADPLQLYMKVLDDSQDGSKSTG